MLKDKGRILGIDDGPFSRAVDRKTVLTGILMRLDGIIEAVCVREITIDGSDAEASIIDMIDEIGEGNIDAVISEGITFGGFNIVSPESVFSRRGTPYVSITHSAADIVSMEAALLKHDETGKIDLLKSLKPVKCRINESEFTLNHAGIELDEALRILKKSMVVGNVPEPVRIAHMASEAFRRLKIHTFERKV